MPGDRAVTNDDVCGLLRAADPDRQFNAPTIRATLHRLVKEGTVRRISNPQAGQKVRYRLLGVDAKPVRAISEWASVVPHAAAGTLKAVEIIVAATEMGYELQSAPSKAVQDLVRSMQKCRDFQETCGEWALVRERNNDLLTPS